MAVPVRPALSAMLEKEDAMSGGTSQKTAGAIALIRQVAGLPALAPEQLLEWWTSMSRQELESLCDRIHSPLPPLVGEGLSAHLLVELGARAQRPLDAESWLSDLEIDLAGGPLFRERGMMAFNLGLAWLQIDAERSLPYFAYGSLASPIVAVTAPHVMGVSAATRFRGLLARSGSAALYAQGQAQTPQVLADPTSTSAALRRVADEIGHSSPDGALVQVLVILASLDELKRTLLDGGTVHESLVLDALRPLAELKELSSLAIHPIALPLVAAAAASTLLDGELSGELADTAEWLRQRMNGALLPDLTVLLERWEKGTPLRSVYFEQMLLPLIDPAAAKQARGLGLLFMLQAILALSSPPALDAAADGLRIRKAEASSSERFAMAERDELPRSVRTSEVLGLARPHKDGISQVPGYYQYFD